MQAPPVGLAVQAASVAPEPAALAAQAGDTPRLRVRQVYLRPGRLGQFRAFLCLGIVKNRQMGDCSTFRQMRVPAGKTSGDVHG